MICLVLVALLQLLIFFSICLIWSLYKSFLEQIGHLQFLSILVHISKIDIL